MKRSTKMTKQYRLVYITRCKKLLHNFFINAIKCMKRKYCIQNTILLIFIAFITLFFLMNDDNSQKEHNFYKITHNATTNVLWTPNEHQKNEMISLYNKMTIKKGRKKKKVTQLSQKTDVLQESINISHYPALGENGVGVVLPKNMTINMKTLVARGWKNNCFNQYVSDRISLKRSLPDVRHEWCKQPKRYSLELPATSVVICFHNEAWSTLLRTVHSVLDRSPEKLLIEIILVDDFSDLGHLKTQLVEYLADYPKVRLVRTDKREGLTRARLIGLQHVTAPIVTYLDSHCECTQGWLEPLLDRIAQDPTTVVCPVIDMIDSSTFRYNGNRRVKYLFVGSFYWDLDFRWRLLPGRINKLRKHKAEPVQTPTMAGGLFAIDKAFFEKLGTYDDAFNIWGGEHLELSFKIWMCGGTLEIVPCSHVGHVYRKRTPYVKDDSVVLKNSIRLAEVWLDEYAKYFYQEVNIDPKERVNVGDLSQRKALRNNLGCKSFDWYMKNIVPDLFIPDEVVARGEIQNLAHLTLKFNVKYCLDFDKGIQLHPMRVFPCHGNGHHQSWLHIRSGQIRKEDLCLDANDGKRPVLCGCVDNNVNQIWRYDPGVRNQFK